MSAIVAEVAEEVAEDLRGRHMLFVGTSELGRLAATALRARGYWEISLASVAPEAEDIAAELTAKTVAVDAIPRAVSDSDLVVICAAVPSVDAELVRRAMRGRLARPLALLDLAGGTALDSTMADLTGVRVVAQGELRERIDLESAQRGNGASLVEAIVEEELRVLQARAGSSSSGVAATLRARAEEIRQREVARALASMPDADDRVRAQLEWLSVSLVSKLLDEPPRRLRADSAYGNGSAYADVPHDVFAPPAERVDRPPA